MQELTVYDYSRILGKRKGLFIFTFALTVLSTAFYTYLQPRVYRAEAIITFRPPASYSGFPGSDTIVAVQTEIRVINSLEIAERTARLLGVITSGSEAESLKISVRMRTSYSAGRLSDSNLISITATGPDPGSAGGLVNAVIESYKEYDLEQKSKQARKKLEDLAARKTEVEESLRGLERTKQNFVEKNPKTGIGAALANQLADLETRKKQLLEKYTPNHPEVVNAEQRLQNTLSRLSEIPAQDLELARLSRELRMQEELYNALNKQYEEARLGLSSVVSFVGVVDPAVPDDIPISPRKWLNLTVGCIAGLFLAGLLVFSAESMDVSMGNIEEIESLIKLPVLGVIPRIPGGDRAQDWLSRLLLRERHTMKGFRNMLLFNKNASRIMVESYYTLRSNLLRRLEPGAGTALVFVSTGKAEGKTLTSLNVALACVHSGMKTLVIDADIRKPWIHQVFALEHQPGLSDVLAKKISWREAVRDSAAAAAGLNLPALNKFPGIENFSLLTCGSPHADVIDLMDCADWPALIADLKTEFDMIIFDMPPVLSFSDSLTVSRHCDGVVLVYRAGKMTRNSLMRARDQILGINARIIGVVLNNADRFGKEEYYNYY